MSRKLCEICQTSPATVPDRNRGGRPINRVCGQCHAARLKADLTRIIKFNDDLQREMKALGITRTSDG